MTIPTFQLDKSNIERTPSIKVLGVLLDENLLWKDHNKPKINFLKIWNYYIRQEIMEIRKVYYHYAMPIITHTQIIPI